MASHSLPVVARGRGDQIDDTGTILLLDEPELAILPWNNFVPAMGDQFVVMTWAEGCKRRCEELRRQLRRRLTRAKQELRRLLAQRGAVPTWFERRPRASGGLSGRSHRQVDRQDAAGP